MQPFDLLGLPSPEDCYGMIGVLVSLVMALIAFVWVGLFQGGTSAFLLLALGVVLGISSFIYCAIWEQSNPIIK